MKQFSELTKYIPMIEQNEMELLGLLAVLKYISAITSSPLISLCLSAWLC